MASSTCVAWFAAMVMVWSNSMSRWLLASSRVRRATVDLGGLRSGLGIRVRHGSVRVLRNDDTSIASLPNSRTHRDFRVRIGVSRRLPALSQKSDVAYHESRWFPRVPMGKQRKMHCFIAPKRWLARVLPAYHSMSIVNRKHLAHSLGVVAAVSMLALWNTPAAANGIYRDGVGARSVSMGGADVAWVDDPLGAMGVNPAGLGFQSAAGLNLGLIGGSASGHFEKQGISDGSLDQTLNMLPEAAFAMPIGKLPVTVGLAVVPDAMMSANWHYTDPPGGLGAVFVRLSGRQIRHRTIAHGAGRRRIAGRQVVFRRKFGRAVQSK